MGELEPGKYYLLWNTGEGFAAEGPFETLHEAFSAGLEFHSPAQLVFVMDIQRLRIEVKQP